MERYEIRVRSRFSAAHYLRDYRGPCSRVHGHGFEVEVAVGGSDLGPDQLLVDFHDLKEVLNRVLEEMDHRFLNEMPPFDRLSPTSENIARLVYEKVEGELKGLGRPARLLWVSVAESPDTRVVYRG
ncbi:MAG: 6-carboxytetrahydropterin synthase QueD [Candidatus Geothermincolales bacterium]